MTDDRGLPQLDVFTRRGCHLCEVLIEELLPLVRGKLAVRIADVDDREDWQATYGERVPVVEFDGETVCQYRLDRDAIGAIFDRLVRSQAGPAASTVR